MDEQEINMAIDWAAAEGWNPGLSDAVCFRTADPDGFFVGMLGDEPIATLSAVKYGNTFGFIGFYMVKPEYRGKGYGIQIWNRGLEYLKGRLIGLDGVVSQQDNYKKSGFELAYRNIRQHGAGSGKPLYDHEILNLSGFGREEIYAYDERFFPDNRIKFTKSWITMPRSKGLGIMRNKTLAGYGVIRKCISGYKIGPLFADSPELADRLFIALTAQAPKDAPVFLDTPEVNTAAIDLAERHNMTAEFETARMYRGNKPDLPINRIFGVTTFELG